MRVAILDPFSGIAGDMTLGALLQVGLDPDWLRALPAALGLDGVRVEIRSVRRADLECAKVDFEIPPQPHGRHLRHIHALVDASAAPARVKKLANDAFTAIATAESEIHGTSIEKVHLHEVGSVDAILDIVGSIWGFERLGVERVYCGRIPLGDGTVRAAHGVLPVPAPATLKLLQGHPVSPGPEGSGELVTPTGAAIVRVLTKGRAPTDYVPVRSGFGAGTKDFPGRANALRIVLARHAPMLSGAESTLALLTTDIDDMSPEYIAAAAEAILAAGALDVTRAAVTMKKGRIGTRLEVLCETSDAIRFEEMLLTTTTSIGVRRTTVGRRALPRTRHVVSVHGHQVAVKSVTRPDGTRTFKPEHEDVARVAQATSEPWQSIFRAAVEAAERATADWV